MQKGILKTKKGYTASEINFYVDDDGDIRYSYEVEPIAPEYKCGDVVVLGNGYIAIYQGCGQMDNVLTTDGEWAKLRALFCQDVIDSFSRLATPEEVFRYHKALRDAGYEWDADRRDFIEVAWKPKGGEVYWCVYSGNRFMRDISVEFHSWEPLSLDNIRHNIGNCFRTKEAAQAAADQIKEVLKNAPKE